MSINILNKFSIVPQLIQHFYYKNPNDNSIYYYISGKYFDSNDTYIYINSFTPLEI